MIDKEAFRRKLVLRAITGKTSLIPTVGGITLLFGSWVLGLGSALSTLFFLAMTLVGAGIAVTRILLQTESIAKKVMQEIENEAKAENDRKVADLRRRLMHDDDPRTERLLDDLMALTEAFKKDQGWTAKTVPADMLDIINDVDRLAEGCMRALEQTLVQHERQTQLHSAELRARYAERREKLIKEVHDSIVRLSDIHAKVQDLATRNEEDSTTALGQLRTDLDENLRIAEEVDKRMREFNDPNKGKEFEQYA